MQGLLLAGQPPVGQGLLINEVSRSHTTTHHSRQDSPGRVISPTQRPLPDSTQNSQQTDIQAPGIRTHSLNSRTATGTERCRVHTSTQYIEQPFNITPRPSVILWNIYCTLLLTAQGYLHFTNKLCSTLRYHFIRINITLTPTTGKHDCVITPPSVF